ncbi:hypothetical protein KKI24_11305 [bacterium]|nr:hypothetical protein [bacterium]
MLQISQDESVQNGCALTEPTGPGFLSAADKQDKEFAVAFAKRSFETDLLTNQ